MTAPSYSAACDAVVEAFLVAFPQHVRSRVAEIAPGIDIAGAMDQGLAWLTAELTQWAALPVADQRQGPLHIMQTAFAIPTQALEAAAVAPVERDVGAQQALPGDLYGLAPVSSRDLGEEAWRAHVAWGVAKAKVVVNAVPVPKGESTEAMAVAAVTMNQADRASIHLVATGRGIPTRHWRNPGAIAAGLEKEIPRWAVVDLDHAAAETAVRALAAAGAKVAVYGPDPDDIAMARWMAIGAATVVPRGRLVAVLQSWLPLQA